MDIDLDFQVASDGDALLIPDESQLLLWVEAAVRGGLHAVANGLLPVYERDLPEDEMQLTVRVVDESECAELNESYRDKTGPTNVLSFPYDEPSMDGVTLLGDIVICQPVVVREALKQNRPLQSHWTHLIVHGVLHLLGYDHESQDDALVMESLETEIMATLGFADPYIN